MESRLPQVSKLYKFTKPNIFSDEVRSRLPEAYKNFYKEWKLTPPTPVHYRPKPGIWERDPDTGVVTPIQNIPIPIKFPKESHFHLWGGEGVVQGFQKRAKFVRRIPHFWVPVLKKSVVYSEILDKRMSVILTDRTINLIIDNHGFDNYILKTPANDLQSLLALKLKRKMLLSLFDKNLYNDNPTKQEEVYNKYKHYLDSLNREDLEWYGLSVVEAERKLLELEEGIKPKPLKHQFRMELLAKLYDEALTALEEKSEKEESRSEDRTSWLAKLNPFSKR